jgi:hypothetical protein
MPLLLLKSVGLPDRRDPTSENAGVTDRLVSGLAGKTALVRREPRDETWRWRGALLRFEALDEARRSICIWVPGV